MVTKPDPITVSPAGFRRLARENQEMGRKLAQHEYHAMLRELSDPAILELKIDFANDIASPIQPPVLEDDHEMRRLPQLNVELGSVAWVHAPDRLPVIGIFVPDADSAVLCEALSALITAHYTKPFARFVFLCETLRPAPLLGRYQFTFDHLGPMPPVRAAQRLRHRFGGREIRELITGDRIWQAEE